MYSFTQTKHMENNERTRREAYVCGLDSGVVWSVVRITNLAFVATVQTVPSHVPFPPNKDMRLGRKKAAFRDISNSPRVNASVAIPNEDRSITHKVSHRLP